MSQPPPALAYAAALPLDAPGDPARIERTDEGLFVTIPPPKLWVLLAGPTVGLVFAMTPLMFLLYVAATRFTRYSEVNGCFLVGCAILLMIAGYNLKRLLAAARFGRKSTTISMTRYAIIIERGTDGAVPKSITSAEPLLIDIRQSAPTLTFGRLVDIRFGGIGGEISARFYTREWTLAPRLRTAIYEQLASFRAAYPPAGQQT